MAAEAVPNRYLSVAQVARRLGCSVSLVQKWRRLGWLTAARLGPPDVPVYGYLPEDVDRFARERWNRRRGRPPLARAARPAVTRAPVVTRTTTVPAPPPPAPSTPPAPLTQPALRPLVLWDADPRAGTALVLARFRPDEFDYALRVAAAWAHRYQTLALGEAPTSSQPATVLDLWHEGQRVRDASQ